MRWTLRATRPPHGCSHSPRRPAVTRTILIGLLDPTEVRNALTEGHQTLEFVEVCERIKRDPSGKVLILTGRIDIRDDTHTGAAWRSTTSCSRLRLSPV